MKRHPIQPLELDGNGTLRFKENKIVRWMLDTGGIDMNKIAMQGFDKDEQEHFAQLIGYSLSGYGGLSYVSDQTYNAAEMAYTDETENAKDALIASLQGTLELLRKDMAGPISTLFGIHEDDLKAGHP